ncbi:alpha-ketoglutarate-dependent dioxygenase AlkB [Anabaena sp. FACHB-1237]|uniref:alpha-ketoglutarate-dependent dioxygenase AlkB family protein n=1 Tax=Anabaena sp. FACHB-1237 TaxID=2692769 RepID=UPI001681A8D5|nr:alpha-ketoglutarate-dependent dioxygenase AlkB [Anabaena sp. FACHB-1237]MBD2136312.1 alpha-ketoglutarate-dependent dioxygenase AlkB [Anabaena sp. FACHB-1237]
MKYDINSQLNLNLGNAEISPNLQLKTITIPDGELIFSPNYFTQEESNIFYENLLTEVNWRQDKIKLYGKEMDIPRLTAWYGDDGKCYTYSRITMSPNPWIPGLISIKNKVEKVVDVCFNSVLINLYRHGQDSMAWHSDDEPELGRNPVIASVTFGGARKFKLRHKFNKGLDKVELVLNHGSLLIMQGTTQEYWQHQIPKTAKVISPRINLTFRVIQ